MTEINYPLGKLPHDHLSRLLANYHPTDQRLVLGGKVGEDAAVIDMGDRYLVVKTDPITFATDEIGWYAVNVNANDIACMGATPKWFLATILLPERKTPPSLVDKIFGQITAACNDLGVTLAGGHTEITYGIDRPIVVGQMLGEAEKTHLVSTGGAKPGDDLLLTKQIAIEATAIMAQEKRAELQSHYSNTELDRLANLLHDPGISVVREAQIAMSIGGIHAMHDPTEGGIATSLWELSEAAGIGLEIYAEHLPYHSDCKALCDIFGLDPLGVIASGSLLLAISPDKTSSLREALKKANITVSVIGQVKEPSHGVYLVDGVARHTLPKFSSDEITKLFA